jgi:hypothetical protein
LDSSSNWSAIATATSTISGQDSLSFSSKGSLAFTVFLSKVSRPEGAAASVIPQNSVLGRMAGAFEAEVSTPTGKVMGEGTAGWIVGGLYDPVTETIGIAIRSSDIDSKERLIPLEKAGETTAGLPFSTTLNWGWNAPRNYLGDVQWGLDPSTVLAALKTPSELPVSGREVDNWMVRSLPQTGLAESQQLRIDLKDAEPQTIAQTFQDEAGLGERTTTWTLTLMPLFEIERDGHAAGAAHSFVSTDSVNLRMVIPGVNVERSGWADLPSWEVKGTGPSSGSGIPSQMEHSTAFSFQPDPGERPRGGSTLRNPPMQYTVSATIKGSKQFFILTQDETDVLRQEYIDHGLGFVPSRGECVGHPIDDSFNEGNYRVMIDGGTQEAFDKIASEFQKERGEGVLAVGGFRSPQRNKAVGDLGSSKHVLGRALDLAPQVPSVTSLTALYETCARAGYHNQCEAAPGREVPPGSPEGRHVHIDW